jgi:cell division transport system permease protein
MTDADLAHKVQVASHRRQSRIVARRPNQLVPANTVASNALTIVIAIMSFLACLTLGAVTLVRDASRDWQLDVRREVTIQIRPIDGVALDTEAARAAAIARQTPGVAAVEVLDESHNASLLEPWLGAGFNMADLPVPRLVAVRLADRNVNLDDLATRLRNEVRGASLDDHGVWASRLQTMAGFTVIGGLVVLGLVLSAAALSVIFATRGAMAGNSHIVSVLHFVGAEDAFIAREFQRHFLLLGLRGGLIGAAMAAFVFAVIGFLIIPAMIGSGAENVSALFGRFTVGPVGYFGAIGIAFLVAVMTALTSRLTVYGYLSENE